MQVQGITMPGFRIYEYKLIINPHEALQDKIRDTRDEFNRAFKPAFKNSGRPNVAIGEWMQYEMAEKRIVEKLKMVAMGYPPFKIELRGFGSYPSHSIFINMVSKLPVKSLIKEIRENAGSLLRLNKDTKVHFFDEPNISLGFKLVPWQYEKAWLEYSQKHFTGKFIADGMLLLKRPEDKSDGWQILERFEFANLDINVKVEQGELF